MTPDQHHAEALRVLALAEDHWLNPEGDYEPTTDPDELATREAIREDTRREALVYLGIAQVHATLSLRQPTEEQA